MESEACPIVRYPHPSTPATHYRCDGCDSEWVWTKGRGETVRFLDGADVPLAVSRRFQ